jgi:hypothetical protein
MEIPMNFIDPQGEKLDLKKINICLVSKSSTLVSQICNQNLILHVLCERWPLLFHISDKFYGTDGVVHLKQII